MADQAITEAFLRSEIERLEPFDAVMISPAESPLAAVEVTHGEEDGLEVRIPGRPPFAPELEPSVCSKLGEIGFVSENAENRTKPWVKKAEDVEAALSLVWRVFREVFEAKPGVALDIAHGSHRAEHEARQKLLDIRERIEKPLVEIAGGPVAQDTDGDYVLPVKDVHVTVAPRVLPGGRVIVRVFAVANVGVNVTPELGLLLARLNFSLMFGRFALDAEQRSIWFDETLLGDQLSDDTLRFAIDVVATTADEWDDRLKQMFGGMTYQEMMKNENAPREKVTPMKPGDGGYI